MQIRRLFKSELFVKVVFVFSLFLIIIVAGIGFKHIKNLTKSTDLVMHTTAINLQLEQILSYLKDAETGQRGFIATQDSLYLEPYFSGRKNINNSFAEIKALTLNDTVQKKNLLTVSKLIDKRLTNFESENKFAEQFGTSSKKFKTTFFQGKQLMDSIRVKLNSMIALEKSRLKTHIGENKSVIKNTPFLLYSLVFFTLLVIYFSYSRIIRNLEELKANNQQLNIFKKATMQTEAINNVGSWRWNVDRNEFKFSDNLFRLLGEEPGAFPETVEAFNDFVHPDDLDRLSEQVDAMMQNKDLPFVYFRVIHRNGTVRHLKSYGKSIENEDGTNQLLGTTTDITDEISNMHLLQQRNVELEQNNKELQAFNYVASHDLQEPLRKIQTFLSRLEEKEETNLSKFGKRYIERINDASARMRQLIDDLLQFSRTNKSTELLVEEDLNILLEAAIEDLANLILKSGATVKADQLPKAKVIPFQIQQLFTNLIGNAIKYAHEDRKPIINIKYELVINEDDFDDTLKENSNYHEIIISDNGIGFDPEYAEKIFILFNRLHNKDEYSGTGIGLSICKKIMDNHRGEIKARGVEGKGAEFTIKLPIFS